MKRQTKHEANSMTSSLLLESTDFTSSTFPSELERKVDEPDLKKQTEGTATRKENFSPGVDKALQDTLHLHATKASISASKDVEGEPLPSSPNRIHDPPPNEEDTFLFTAVFELYLNGTFKYVSPELWLVFHYKNGNGGSQSSTSHHGSHGGGTSPIFDPTTLSVLDAMEIDVSETSLDMVFEQPEVIHQALHTFLHHRPALSDPYFSLNVALMLKNQLVLQSKGMLIQNDLHQPSHLAFVCSGNLPNVFCYICERQVVAILFEAHGILCMQAHQAELKLNLVLDQLNEYKAILVDPSYFDIKEASAWSVVCVLRDWIDSASHVHFHVDDFNFNLPIQFVMTPYGGNGGNGVGSGNSGGVGSGGNQVATDYCPIWVPACLFMSFPMYLNAVVAQNTSLLSSSSSSSSTVAFNRLEDMNERFQILVHETQGLIQLYLSTLYHWVLLKQRYWAFLQKEKRMNFNTPTAIPTTTSMFTPFFPSSSSSTSMSSNLLLHPSTPSNLTHTNPTSSTLSMLPSLSPATSMSSSPTIRDYILVKPISKGAFGSVYLAKKKTTGEYFAIKRLKKADMIAKNQVTNVKAERMILMSQLDNPFVVQLYCSFQSNEALYLVMEYMNGGDCASLLKVMGCLPEFWVQHYIAEMVLCLEYLHAKGIVHRDLKPDNFLIHSSGHLRLTDFGLSKLGFWGRQSNQLDTLVSSTSSMHSSSNAQVHTPSPHTTSHVASPSPPTLSEASMAVPTLTLTPTTVPNDPTIYPPTTASSSLNKEMKHVTTPLSSSSSSSSSTSNYSNFSPPKRFVGTPDYLAPESILGISSGADEYAVDWWALGVIFYEFLYGIPPFHASTVDGVFENILKCTVEFPEEEDDFNDDGHEVIKDDNDENEDMNKVKLKIENDPRLEKEQVQTKKEVQQPLSLEDQVNDPSMEHVLVDPSTHLATNTSTTTTTSPVVRVSMEAKDLILKLLCPDPQRRWTSATQVKQHPFFKELDFETLLTSPPPFQPDPTHMEDTDYFDQRGCEPSWEQTQTLPSGTAAEFGSFTYRNLTVLEKANRMAWYQKKKNPITLSSSSSSSSSFSSLPSLSQAKTSLPSSLLETVPPHLPTQPLPHHLTSQVSGGSTPPTSHPSPFNSLLHALVCDDNPITCKILEIMLQKFSIVAIMATNGAEAVKIALGVHRFPFIFMDVKMPIMDGEQAAKLIRCADHVNQHTLMIGMETLEHKFQDPSSFDHVIKKHNLTSRQLTPFLKPSSFPSS
ncbi:hypothetical protein HMI56_000510 [Coelomomyces lativittatus]|nr:hypothetical protein HMI56_000510 [Coelomomyces lativittatus]